MKSKGIFLLSLSSFFILMILGGAVAISEAQQVAPPTDAVIRPALQLRIAPPQVRTWEQMKAAADLEAAAPAPLAQDIPFRPTIGEAAYKAYKAKAAQTRALQAPAAPETKSAVPLAQIFLTNTINFEGVNSVMAGNYTVPDTEGAVGLNHFVEITNSHLDIYEKVPPNNLVNSVSLSAFFGYTSRALFDPRVSYDHEFNRWIISSNAFAESTTVQKFFFAVSQTADPLGAFYIYQVNVSNGLGSFWDFPQLGLDHNAVIFTANLFDSANKFIDARMFAVAKSLLYNGPGQTLTPYMFTGLAGTLAPPLVLDANPNTYLVAADTADNKVTLYTLTNSAADPPTLTAPAIIPVPAYTMPPNAPQPGTTATLDTSDSRFVNASTQIGSSLFQVHSINSGGFARCRFYEFDTVNRQVIQSGTFNKSGTSFDFNASIAANRRKDVFVTWSATEVSNNINAEVRFSGRLHTDPLGVIPSTGSLLFGSSTFYRPILGATEQRWGDYSAVSLDPADPKGLTAWIVNERILTNTTWGSRIGSIGLPALGNNLPAVYLLLLDD
jgi:hypothetical protein